VWLEFIQAVTLIFFAEMGDKTQILAMAFATKYRVRTVLIGIFIGSLLNHGIAVALGSSLPNIIPISTLQIIAGFSFVAFSLWTLKVDEDDDVSQKRSYGPIVTVAVAFFIGELGDKTQLTAIILSTDAQFPLLILLGTVTGMVITGGLGIYVGSKLGSKIPEFTIKMVSATVFMLFGAVKLSQNLPNVFLTPISISLFSAIVALFAYSILKPTLVKRKLGETAFQARAQKLHEFYEDLKLSIEEICLGEDVCGECKYGSCIIGATKSLLSNNEEFEIDFATLNKNFDKIKVIRSLESIINYLDDGGTQTEKIINTMNNLEKILFNKKLGFTNRVDYLKLIKDISPEIERLLDN